MGQSYAIIIASGITNEPSMYALLLIVMLPTSMAFVNCKMACQHCYKELGDEPPVVEIYCAMCQECKERHEERMHMPEDERKRLISSGNNKSEIVYYRETENLPRKAIKLKKKVKPVGDLDRRKHEQKDDSQNSEECPTPPPCSDSSEELVPMKGSTTPSKPAATTTTHRSCPAIKHCRRKKKKTTPPPCAPCMPVCTTPCVPVSTPVSTTTPVTTTTLTTTQGYFYVYVGVPKKLMQH